MIDTLNVHLIIFPNICIPFYFFFSQILMILICCWCLHRSSFTIRQLCSKMNPREVFVCVAEILWRRQTIPQPQPSTLNDPTTTPVQPSTTSTLPPRSTTNSYPRLTSTHLNSLITSDQPVSNNQLSSPTNHPIPNQSTPQQPEPPSPIHYHPDLAFTSNLIRILNTILFTSPELAGLRIELKNLRLKVN